jgi:Trypsin-like peptidase domain
MIPMTMLGAATLLLRMLRSLCYALLVIICCASSTDAAQIPPGFLSSVVALGTTSPSSPGPGQPQATEWRTEGTGFFYGSLVIDNPDPKQRQYQVVLVTARHVVEGHITRDPSNPLSIRMNPDDPTLPGKEFTIDNKAWRFPTEGGTDLAFVPINFGMLTEVGINPVFYGSDMFVADTEKMRETGVSEGDGIFVLGFPMNLAGTQRNYVIARQGCIARVAELLANVSNTFMIDAFVFPGNSGGPVILKTELNAIEGTKAQKNAYLIGMVISYRPYRDVAVSPQTNRPRVVFEENSGLADVVPIDAIEKAFKEWLKSKESSGLSQH